MQKAVEQVLEAMHKTFCQFYEEHGGEKVDQIPGMEEGSVNRMFYGTMIAVLLADFKTPEALIDSRFWKETMEETLAAARLGVQEAAMFQIGHA